MSTITLPDAISLTDHARKLGQIISDIGGNDVLVGKLTSFPYVTSSDELSKATNDLVISTKEFLDPAADGMRDTVFGDPVTYVQGIHDAVDRDLRGVLPRLAQEEVEADPFGTMLKMANGQPMAVEHFHLNLLGALVTAMYQRVMEVHGVFDPAAWSQMALGVAETLSDDPAGWSADDDAAMLDWLGSMDEEDSDFLDVDTDDFDS